MNQVYRPLNLIVGAVAVATLAVAGSPVSAQDAGVSSSTPTTSTSAVTAAKKRPPATATPEMIAEAIQRSLARTEKQRAMGRPEQFGSEEPFTFNPRK